MEREELTAWLRLVLTPGVGSSNGRRLLAAFGVPHQVFAQSTTALQQVVTPTQAEALRRLPPELPALLEATEAWLSADHEGLVGQLVTLGDAAYPKALLATEDPPLMLHLLGPASLLGPTCSPLAWPTRALAMVGSRNPTPQGRQDARQFARAFGDAGICVVSGLALGVDGAAHEGALAACDEAAEPTRLATLAVIGTGIDRVYPRQHRQLAHRIATQGLIVSEYPLGTPPLSANFPRRNRLIAGLTQGTLVVEAALQSGSLITARLATEQGKEVFAIPGSIHSPQSRGCHALIRQGAKLVETAQDVLEELRWPAALDSLLADMDAAREGTPISDDHHAVLQALGGDPVGLDALLARTGLDTAALQARLLELELDGRVGRLPGGLFQRLVRG
jgi:DNA processing protein